MFHGYSWIVAISCGVNLPGASSGLVLEAYLHGRWKLSDRLAAMVVPIHNPYNHRGGYTLVM